MHVQRGGSAMIGGLLLLSGLLIGVLLVAFDHSAAVSDSDAAVSVRQQSAQAPSVRPAADFAGTSDSGRFDDQVRHPDGPPQVFTGLQDLQGNEVSVTCSTCHGGKERVSTSTIDRPLTDFHKDLTVNHGRLTCLSCHNASDYDSLRLADGSRLEFENVMQLCGQCHGSQLRDYQHSVHGGMAGYWDRSRGPRQRLNCIECHDPHAPQFPKMHPTFKPQDRFLNDQESSH